MKNKEFHHETDPQTENEFAAWDTKDKCWIGDEGGAFIFAEKDLARAFATVLGARVRQNYRFRALPFVRGKKKHAGEFTPELTAVEAIRELEKQNDGS